MTFGAVLKLYENLKEKDDKIHIANNFGVRQVVTFENYMHIKSPSALIWGGIARTIASYLSYAVFIYQMYFRFLLYSR